MEVEDPVGLPRALRVLSGSLLVVVFVVVLSGLFLTGKGQGAMQQSDASFHDGDLRLSVVHARTAALAYVPGSGHVKAAYARLEAIAKGAESEGNFEVALLGWDTLRLVLEQTDYPGRPPAKEYATALAGIQRVRGSSEPPPNPE